MIAIWQQFVGESCNSYSMGPFSGTDCQPNWMMLVAILIIPLYAVFRLRRGRRRKK